MSNCAYLACYPWEHIVPYHLNAPSVLACTPLLDEDMLLHWPDRGRKGLMNTLIPYKKVEWYNYRGIPISRAYDSFRNLGRLKHIRLTQDNTLYAPDLVLNDVLDFVICQKYLYVLTEEDITQYALPHPSYWNRVILDFQAPAKLKEFDVLLYNDHHLFRVKW
jgi:hypothetical protein